jgi:AcrR family transcriptional regulator
MTTTPSAPSASRTARERARAELTREIKEEARRQLAASGAQGLSLRAVARELGMVSSAIYRYFPSRDELLTGLIIDAYDALGEAAEGADSVVPPTNIRGRWRAVCGAIRAWALAHPHEYALIYGSPVPGYQAPRATVASAIRVVRVLGGILTDTWAEGRDAEGRDAEGRDAEGRDAEARGVRPPVLASPLPPVQAWPSAPPLPCPSAPPLPSPLAEQAAGVADAIAPGVPGPVVARALIAWTQLFGMISFELFGQFVGSLEPADPFVAYAAEQMADFIGLPDHG